MHRSTRRGFLAAAGLAALAGCSGLGGGFVEPSAPRRTTRETGEVPTATPTEPLPPVADRQLHLSMSPGTIREQVLSGGQPKDGIPSIDDPSFVPAAKANEWLGAEDVVFGLVRNGEVKAYPQSILVWHEICNDVVGGDPVSVTYCPLTGTVLGFERGETSFGVSGRLVNNNLIMYDRMAQLWWPQVLSTSIPSPWNDGYVTRSLRDFRVIWTTWGRWREAHPDTTVLSRDTGYVRNYESDPYGSYRPDKKGYYHPESEPLFRPLSTDGRYPPKRVVMGARTPEGAIAFLKDALRERKVIEGELADTPHLAVYDPALDTGYTYRNPDGESFEFEDGQAVAGDGSAYAPDSLPLDRVHTFDAMWFAWAGFYPETEVYDYE